MSAGPKSPGTSLTGVQERRHQLLPAAAEHEKQNLTVSKTRRGGIHRPSSHLAQAFAHESTAPRSKSVSLFTAGSSKKPSSQGVGGCAPGYPAHPDFRSSGSRVASNSALAGYAHGTGFRSR